MQSFAPRLATILIAVVSTGSVAAADADRIEEASVKAHMEFLASDAMNGRGSGTRDEWIAATYIAAQMRRNGLQPLGSDGDFVQAVEVDKIEATAAPVLEVGGLGLSHGDDMLILRLSAASLSGELQRFRSGTRHASGSILLMPETAGRGVPPQARDASLLLYRETAGLRQQWNRIAQRTLLIGQPRIGSLAQASTAAGPSQIYLSAASYAKLAALPEGLPVRLNTSTRESIGHTWNAVAKLPGADARACNQVILLTAHLDHLGASASGEDRIYHGADDDASGSIAVLTLAEALARGPKLKRTIVFAWFGSEEAGGYGARYFVGKPVVALRNIVANLEFEMIGRPDAAVAAHTLWLTGWERTNLGPQLALHGARLVADPHPEQNFFTRSDNIALAMQGVVAQTVSSFGLHADYHQPTDDISRIDFRHMTESIQSMLQPVRWLADSGFEPEWLPGGRPL
jgi:aminopeptidase YwaD